MTRNSCQTLITVLVKNTNFGNSGNSEAQIRNYLEAKRKTREAV